MVSAVAIPLPISSCATSTHWLSAEGPWSFLNDPRKSQVCATTREFLTDFYSSRSFLTEDRVPPLPEVRCDCWVSRVRSLTNTEGDNTFPKASGLRDSFVCWHNRGETFFHLAIRPDTLACSTFWLTWLTKLTAGSPENVSQVLFLGLHFTSHCFPKRITTDHSEHYTVAVSR